MIHFPPCEGVGTQYLIRRCEHNLHGSQLDQGPYTIPSMVVESDE